MSDNNITELVPKLRFPEFVKDEEWEETTLGKISDITNGKSNAQDHIENGNYPMFDRSAVIKASNNFLFDCEAVIIPGEGMKFIPKYYKGKFDLHQRAYVLKDFSIDGMFGYYSMSHRSNLLALKAVKSTVLSLRLPILQNFPIQIPKSQKEQQKIASCLSSLDEVITAERQKLDILKVHKKGLLQNLLPQEGETVPTFRFKEFEDSGEWEETRLDDVCKFIRGPFGGALKKEIFISDGYAVYEQSHAIYADFTSFRYFITEEKYNELKRFVIQPNDIIMSCSGTMGKFAIIPEHSKKGVINQALLKLSVKPSNDTNFVKASLELPLNQNKLLSQSAGGAIKNVVEVAQIKEIKISIPSFSEQEKIADTLSSIDELIKAQNQKLEALKLHKKGLLQGLFPALSETGFAGLKDKQDDK